MITKNKYKEALDRASNKLEYAKGFDCEHPHVAHEIRETVYEIFPELKESEDDRIRKLIIGIFKDAQRNGVSETIMPEVFEKIFAWLEKQGHDGKKWIYEDVYNKEKEQLYQDGIDDVLNDPQKYGLEKQGEQEPAEWSEEDKDNIQRALYYVDYYRTHEADTKEAEECFDWLKSLKPQKYISYNPYKAVVESIFEMCDKYSLVMEDEERADDFLNVVRVKCKDAIEYDKKYPINKI